MDTVRIRAACKEDVPAILWLIQLLAEAENELHGLKIGEKELLRDGFGAEKYFHVLLAELKDPPPPSKQEEASTGSKEELPSQSMKKDERLVGYALYYYTYSTWEGRVLFVEDLFVRGEHRNKGIGTALLRECAKIAVSKDCARMAWQVLDWNTKAMDLYKRVGGQHMEEWLSVRMTKETLTKFANGEEENQQT